MPATPSPIIWDLVEEHLDEAAFRWAQWERALGSPRYTLREVSDSAEELLAAHLDALVQSGPEAVERLFVPALGHDDAGVVFAAASALAGMGRLEELRKALPPKEAAGRAVGRALALALLEVEAGTLGAWLESGEEGQQAAALEALAFRGARLAPATLTPLFDERRPRCAAAALRAAGLLGDHFRNAIEVASTSPNAEVRDAAIAAGLRLGLRTAFLASRRAVEEKGAEAAFPLEVLAIGGERADLDRIAAALEQPALRPAALWAAGLSGWPSAADLCLPYLEDGRLGPLAFEALTAIGGPSIAQCVTAPDADEDGDDLDDEEGAEAPPVSGPALELPRPDPESVEQAWNALRPQLSDARRYLGGRPLGAEALQGAFLDGAMRRRHALGLELAVRSHGEVRIETHDWAHRQLSAQPALPFRPHADFDQPLTRLLRA